MPRPKPSGSWFRRCATPTPSSWATSPSFAREPRVSPLPRVVSDGRASYRMSCFRTSRACRYFWTSRASRSARMQPLTGTSGRRLTCFTASGRTTAYSLRLRLGGSPSDSPPHLLGGGRHAQYVWLIARRAGQPRGDGLLSYGTRRATLGSSHSRGNHAGAHPCSVV
jgi:hypothetical protein